MTDAALKESAVRRRISLPAVPLSVALAIGWIVAMLVIAAFAEKIAPYGYTQLDLRNRLSAPGNVAHWLGTDELGHPVGRNAHRAVGRARGGNDDVECLQRDVAVDRQR